ncbi:MAG TPA: BTAD domain-containing putative transcriptional regulator [Streptosporangiaceae bacterium]|jgi:DNA-binding SARP family transcriptional activator/Tfp pilus assembly protein PilF|nr:BTAD domain-containing putative transcriptional regulator [Streptosporangiaceae bacterium]
MWFGVLGPLLVRDGDVVVGVPASRQRVLLAALLVHAGKAVPADALAEVIWAGAPPVGAAITLRSHVSRLRRVLGPGAGARVLTRHPGYLLEAGEEEVDLLRFAALCQQGGAAIRAGAWARAWGLLSQALALWRGEPMADIPCGPLHREEVPRLEQMRLQAVEWRTDAGLHLGRQAELVPESQMLAARHPLREGFHAQLMLALYRCGRQAEALAAYQQARKILIEELGTGPGPGLRELHRRILTEDPALGAPESQTYAGGGFASATPRALPAGVRHFTGRAAELVRLSGLLDRSGEQAPAVAISAISGTAGVGKTALAVHWAHQVTGRFPDGQLYVNLRGFDPSGTPVTPAGAVRSFLDALGVAPGRMPADFDMQAALFRSLLAGKRILIVLDNARNVEQVRPLLPGAPGCLVVVTSRCQLTGLAAEGALLLMLDVLSAAEARELLARHLGAERVAAGSRAADELTGLCAGLPLALAITAARAAARPGFPLAALAAELHHARRQLDVLDAGDAVTNIRAVFSWSQVNLSAPAARMFRLLGLHPGPDFSAPAAASLAGVPFARAQALLSELSRASLIAEHVPGRFACHDLLRAYAAEQASAADGDPGCRAAIDRMLDHYLHTAHGAVRLLYPARGALPLGAPCRGSAPESIAEYGHAWAWFDAECPVLIPAITLAARSGLDTRAWQLAWTLVEFLDRRSRLHDLAATQEAALAAAVRTGGLDAQGRTHRDLGYAYGRLGAFGDARRHLRCALDIHLRLEDRAGQARVHYARARVFEMQDDRQGALGEARQALKLYQAAGHRGGQARALNAVGWYSALLGDHCRALAYCEEAISLLRDLGDRAGEADTWDSLGYAHHQLGHHAEAVACYTRAVDPYRDLGDRSSQALALIHIGETHHAAGNSRAARDAWQQALAVLDELRSPGSDTRKLRAKLRDLLLT